MLTQFICGVLRVEGCVHVGVNYMCMRRRQRIESDQILGRIYMYRTGGQGWEQA